MVGRRSASFYKRSLAVMTTHEKLIQSIKDRCLEFGDFTLSSGKKSNFYIDLRRLMFSAGVSDVVCELEWHLRHVPFDAIGGPALGAVPIIGAFLHNASFDRPLLRGFAVRSEKKDHGANDLVVGSVKKNDRVVIVEDVATTGGSLLRAVDAVQALGCRVAAAVAVLDRQEGAAEALLRRDTPFLALTTIRDIIPPEQLTELVSA